MALNKVMLIGNVGKDPEVRDLEGGAKVANFTLATTERYKDRSGETRELTEWHNIVCWRQLADLTDKYIRKGSQIYVEGRIRSRSYEAQNGGGTRYVTEILADAIQLLGSRRDQQGVPTGGAYTPTASNSAPAERHSAQSYQPSAESPRQEPRIAPQPVEGDPFGQTEDDLPF